MALSVTDYGIGISPEELDNIFKPFYTTKPGGLGVGLYLAKRFIESNLGGSLSANSSPRRTVFTMTLPRHK
jgi:signal transduction histidine kinase